MDHWQTFAKQAARPGPPPYQALCDLVVAELDVSLFTVMTFDPETSEAQRIWSNQPEAYPAGGRKPAPETDWGKQVLEDHEPFVGNSIEALAEHFSDHELIRSLGCESCLNLPVVLDGKVLGTLNCLGGPGHFTPERVARAARLVAPGAVCLLRQKSIEERNAA